MLAFRADHIGSLLRPKVLREAFRKHAGGELAERKLCAARDECVREVIKLQEDCGLPVITDGEFRRVSSWSAQRGVSPPYVCANVARSAPITVDEFRFVKQHTARAASMSRGGLTKLPMCSA